MWSKSNSLVVAFVLVSAILVGGFVMGWLDSPFKQLGDMFTTSAANMPGGFQKIFESLGVSLSTDFDMWTAFMIVVLGLVAYVAGAEAAPLLVMGSLFVFFTLTLNEVALARYLTLAAMLFSIGLYGMTTSRNAVRVLMCIELMLNAVNINMVAFSRYVDPADLRGQIFAVFILTVAAAEAAVGLAIVLAIYRTSQTVNMEKFNLLKW